MGCGASTVKVAQTPAVPVEEDAYTTATNSVDPKLRLKKAGRTAMALLALQKSAALSSARDSAAADAPLSPFEEYAMNPSGAFGANGFNESAGVQVIHLPFKAQELDRVVKFIDEEAGSNGFGPLLPFTPLGQNLTTWKEPDIGRT